MANERVLDQLTSDPDFLSLSEADQDQMYEELAGKRQTGFLEQVPRVLSAATLSPMFGAARTATQLMPTPFLQPAGAIAGGVLGEAVGGPPGMIAGTGLGSALGGTLAEARSGRVSEQPLMGGVRDAALAATGAGAVGVVKKAVPLFRGLKTAMSGKRVVEQARKARQIFQQVESGAGPALANELRGLKGAHDASATIQRIRQLSSDPDFALALEDAMSNAAKVGDDTLEQVLTHPDPTMATRLNPYQVQQVSTTLDQTTSSLRRISQSRLGQVQPGSRELLKLGQFDTTLRQLSDDLSNQLVKAYPDVYPKILQKYGQTKHAAEVLSPAFSERGDRLVKNIKGGFGGGETAQLVKETLPKSITKPMFETAGAQKVMDYVNPVAVARRIFTRR